MTQRESVPDQSNARQDWREVSRVRRLCGLPPIPDDHFYVVDTDAPGECGNPTCLLPREASCHLDSPASDETQRGMEDR